MEPDKAKDLGVNILEANEMTKQKNSCYNHNNDNVIIKQELVKVEDETLLPTGIQEVITVKTESFNSDYLEREYDSGVYVPLSSEENSEGYARRSLLPHEIDTARERKVITEVLELYQESVCLWDTSLQLYSNPNAKTKAWELLKNKLQEIDPHANITSTKRKIDNLKTSYQREAKKVKEYKNRTGSATNKIYKPNLWYYDLLTFLEKKNHVQKKGIDTLSDNEYEPDTETSSVGGGGKKRKKKTRRSKCDQLIDTAQNLLSNQKTNAFGSYVGEKIDQITSSEQRDLAEKLITEILFLAKSSSLSINTKIDTPEFLLYDSSLHHNPTAHKPNLNILNTIQIQPPKSSSIFLSPSPTPSYSDQTSVTNSTTQNPSSPHPKLAISPASVILNSQPSSSYQSEDNSHILKTILLQHPNS